MKRNISGPIVLGSAAAREQKERARRWLTRIGVVISFLILVPLVLYLAISVSNLQNALHEAKEEQQNLVSQLQLTAKHSSVRRDIGKLLPAKVEFNNRKKQTLVLVTKVGDIRIVLRPDLSKESVEYINETAKTGCKRCNLYRAEKPGVLIQGALEGETADSSKVPRGECPVGYERIQNVCPEDDASCGCHGPVLSRGTVAWAAGLTGPDFFINCYPQLASWWGTIHTCFGEIQDDASFQVIEEIWRLPTHKIEVGFTHLNEPLSFQMIIEEALDLEIGQS